MAIEINKKKVLVIEPNKSIETNLKEITNVENFISKILGDESFDKLNHLRNNYNQTRTSIHQYNYNFVSSDINLLEPYINLITEEEFFKIVGANKKRIYKTSGLYQEKLYSNYMKAKQEQDKGYISDVLKKAITLQDNINRVKILMGNKRFMKEWRKNFGKISPVFILKNSGSLRQIEIIKRMI